MTPHPEASAGETTDWCPVYEKDGDEMIFLRSDFRADDEDTAWKIGLGSMLVECILWGIKYKRVIGINRENFPHRKASIAGYPVAIIAGPHFDEAAEEMPNV